MTTRPAPGALCALWIAAFSLAACGGSDTGTPGTIVPVTVVTRTVVPSDTSPAIVPTGADHYIALGPPALSIGTLLVFYPGTDARPDQYSYLLRRAAALGYHVIGLAYHNAESINFQICPGEPDTCHEQARLEILLGTESGYNPPNVNPENSAFERLLRLLQYLNQHSPEEGWATYLDDAGAQPEWSRIAVGGHSQGGGHAAMTAKIRLVARVLMFGATEPVTWTTASFATPPVRFFGLAHTAEPNYGAIVMSWENLQIPGALTSTDGAAAPYGGSHRLTTSVAVCTGDPADPGYYHNCPVVDSYLPFISSSGEPLFQSVWDYLLQAP
jgi:hypothetical protein